MRRFPLTALSLAASILILKPLTAVDALSSKRNPIAAISTVQNATVHTNSHRATALSEFELTFNLPDDFHVKLELEPNHDIVAQGASISYLAVDGTVEKTEPIDRRRQKVYKGAAWVRRSSIGQNQWQRVGWARVGLRRDGETPIFEGAFSVHHDHHHIQTSFNYLRTRHPMDPLVERPAEHEDEYMIVWKDSDIVRSSDETLRHQDLRRGVDDANAPMCSSDQLRFNADPEHPVYRRMMKRSDTQFGLMSFSAFFGKRQIDSSTGGNSAGVNLVSTIGQTAGCPRTRKVALVGVATDCTYTASFNSTETARENVINQMNQASAVWEDAFNISLGLQNITISAASCPGTPSASTAWNQACSDGVDIEDRLNLFSAWRGTQSDQNSHWTLLSTCNTASAVGLAWLGQACVHTAYNANSSQTGNGASGGSETVTGANVVIRTEGASEWQIIAHETGHTFGAVHDCTSSTCANSNVVNSQQCCPLSSSTCDAGEQYIMNPSTSLGITRFSACSIGNICSGILRNSIDTTCLSDNSRVETITGQQCGNGIVEPGEDCDCGGEAGCTDDPCCDATTCKFKNGAVCDDSNDDCCRSCQLATNGTVCRESTGQCDPQEVCTGSSASCPADVTAPDGESCGDGLQCASGQCTSRDQQCKTVMGSYTQGNDTYACDHSTCQISCASPEFGYGVCYGLQQNFLDGTTCDGGGRCENGQCKGASVGGQVRSWINDHKDIVIGVSVSVGALLLLSILGCLYRCCKRRRRTPKHQLPRPPPSGWQGWDGARSGPQMQQQYHPQREASQSWSRNAPNGSAHWPPPPPPPPIYDYSSPGGRSVRYA